MSSLSIFSRSVSSRVKELQSSLVTDIKHKLAEQFFDELLQDADRTSPRDAAYMQQLEEHMFSN